MRANEVVQQPAKKTYVKPELATHGSVQQLTEGAHREHHGSHDCGSNIRLPGDWNMKGWW